jgi:hypothetical protein
VQEVGTSVGNLVLQLGDFQAGFISAFGVFLLAMLAGVPVD